MTNIPNEKTEKLRSKVKGQIVIPGDPNYDEVRKIWNSMIDRRPAVIVQCVEADDVPYAISFARQNGLDIYQFEVQGITLQEMLCVTTA